MGFDKMDLNSYTYHKLEENGWITPNINKTDDPVYQLPNNIAQLRHYSQALIYSLIR